MDATAAAKQRTFSERLVFYGAVFLALLSLYEPIKDGYTRWLLPEIEDEPVEVALQQQRLTEKNLDCLVGATPQEVPLNDKVKVRLLACDTGDVHVAVYPDQGPAKLRWITPHAPKAAKTALLSPLDFVISPALAWRMEAGRLPVIQTQIANVCSGWQDPGRRTKLVRVTNEGGRCFKEIVNVFTGRIDYREQVPCNTPCS